MACGSGLTRGTASLTHRSIGASGDDFAPSLGVSFCTIGSAQTGARWAVADDERHSNQAAHTDGEAKVRQDRAQASTAAYPHEFVSWISLAEPP